ncbi:TerB N-terminal domain-containing protein [Paenibacillus sp.]|uniref:TerB N-terminal domain-containing protein n=1 Tax=Paenibacillus sp. TaxID=58172 RepID=UPI00283AB619|nr:TerB N-terminal domain-containing protein [Paenibacillus sp.]
MYGSMNPDNKSLDFAEIDISDDQDRSSASIQEMIIPERENPSAQQPPLFTQELTKERRFLLQARDFADREGEPAAYAPFMSYWPTYEHMSESQCSWYFYWRSEVRMGRYPFTDLSYIFVYLYELIHGVGWDKPDQGYELMVKIWDAYGEKYPKLNGYMADWISDFVLVHQLDLPLMDIVTRSQSAKAGELYDLELTRLFTYEPSALSFEHILTLSDYDVERSKFYLDGGKALLEEYVPKVVILVDSFLQKTTGKKLVDTFYQGRGKWIERYLFRSAIYDADMYGRTFPLHISQLRKCPPLRYYITQLVRCTENKLRELQHFKGRLRGVTLKQETETLIARFLDKEFTPQKPAGPIISIDPGRLAELQKDSEEVRSMLTVEDVQSVEHVQSVEEKLAPDHLDHHSGSDQEIVWDTSSLDEEWILFARQLGQVHLEALYALKSEDASFSLDRIAEKYGTMPALLLDEINEFAMETIGDLVVDGESIAEEYIDCFELLQR